MVGRQVRPGARGWAPEVRLFLTSGLLRRLLLVQLALALVPLIVAATFARNTLSEAAGVVVTESQEYFDRKSFEGLRQRDVSLAQSVASFLSEREDDLRVAATLPRTAEAYAAFGQAKRGRLWTVGADGAEVQQPVPLYRQIAFVDASGQEVAAASNQCTAYPFDCSVGSSSDLVDVSNPANTLYGSETYFADTMSLPRDAVYVGKPTGSYVPYEEAYASAQNREGRRYRGVVRFAMPIDEGGQRLGILVLSLESIHLIEQVAHVAPANPLPQAEVDPREADFTYMVGPEGWTIAHPRHFNIAGLDNSGTPVPSISEQDRADPDNLFRPGNLTQMGFIDPALPSLVDAGQAGSAADGVTLTSTPFAGPQRAIAYATIPYYTGQYDTPAGFGTVVMSTDWARFHLESEFLGLQVENRVDALGQQAQALGVATAIVALLLAALLALGIAHPIIRLTAAANNIERERWDLVPLERLQRVTGHDEIARLTRMFASMATEVRSRIVQLREQVQNLQIMIDQTKRETEVSQIVESDFFQDLTEKARQMRQQRRQRVDASLQAPDAQP